MLAVAPFLLKIDAEWAKLLSPILGAVGAAFMGIHARDNNVSSEEAGAKKPE